MKYSIIPAALMLTLCACSGGDKAASSATETDSAVQEAPQASVQSEATELLKAAEAKQGVIEITDDEAIRPGKPVGKVTFIDLSAEWCVPCKKFAPAFHEVAREFDGQAYFLTMDYDVLPNTVKAMRVSAVPTLIILDADGNEIKRYEGIGDLLPAEKFRSIVKANI